jgi:hypothetical protein
MLPAAGRPANAFKNPLLVGIAPLSYVVCPSRTRGVRSRDGECRRSAERRPSACRRVCDDWQQTFFGGAVRAQQAVNEDAALLQKYLHRWSAYAGIVQGNNRAAATRLVCSMLADVEGLGALTETDAETVAARELDRRAACRHAWVVSAVAGSGLSRNGIIIVGRLYLKPQRGSH